MDCSHAQDLILDALDAALDTADRDALARHLEGCDACLGFAWLQRQLDAGLREGVPVRVPSAGFRRALAERLAASQPWPDWLPELAYVAGAALATAATIVTLPLPVSSTWWIGGALAGAGLLVHALLAQALSALDATEQS